MTETVASFLLIDPDRAFTQAVRSEANARGYRVSVATSVGEAFQCLEHETCHALVMGAGVAIEGGVEISARLGGLAMEKEVLVVSEQQPVSVEIQGLDPESVWFVRKADIHALFMTLGRALARRRMLGENRRLVWELRTISELAPLLTKSLDLDDVLTGALLRLMRAMQAIGGSIKLRDRSTGACETRVVLGPRAVRRVLTDRWPGMPGPSDEATATRTVVVVDDLRERLGMGEDLAVRSVIAVPMFAATELLGTLALVSKTPRRFHTADQEFLATVAGQIAVAVQNAELHRSTRRAKREWEQTVDAISDPIAVFNNRGELLRGNQALAAHLSLPVTAIRSLWCGDIGFCGGETHAECSVMGALAQRELRGEVRTADGQIFSVTTFPIGTPSEGPSVVQVAKNVTEEIENARRLQQVSIELSATNERLMSTLDQLRSAQTQLVQAEKLSAIGQLAAGVAHELNNPLTSVIGYAQLVEQELQQGLVERPPNEIALDLRRIANESERAARIVRNLSAFARSQATARTSTDVVELCSRVLELRQSELRRSDIELRTDFAPALPRLLADAGQLQQVLLNLILNAEQAMRGTQVRHLAIGTLYDSAAQAIQLFVNDSGHGIDPARLPRIFDPFFTTREVGEGSGLGLSICYGIVRDHGGQIHVESKPHLGTTINVVLPALSEDSSVGETEILVAHSEASEREYLAAALAGWGFRTVTAATVREALEISRIPTIDVAVVEGRLLAGDLAAWRGVGADDRALRVVIAAMPPDEPAVARFGREQAAAMLVTPIQLRALREAVAMSSKEWV